MARPLVYRPPLLNEQQKIEVVRWGVYAFVIAGWGILLYGIFNP